MAFRDLLYRGVLPFKDFLHCWKVQRYYKSEGNPEILETLSYIRRTGKVRGLNYSFVEKYLERDISVSFDNTEGLFYVNHNDRKMFYSRSYSTVRDVVESYRMILAEQDESSPHCYLSKSFYIEQGSIVVDAGVAEGNFSLDNINKCKKLILVECDEEWVKALKVTFREEMKSGKVVIIEKKLGKDADSKTTTLDQLYDKYGEIDFIKMDIEGFEQEAILGGKRLINDTAHLKMAVCSYHTPDSFVQIKELLKNDFSLEVSKRYMVLNPLFGWKPPYFRRGIIRATKFDKQEG